MWVPAKMKCYASLHELEPVISPKPIQPGPGQESVWAYPRPPILDLSDRHVVVRMGETQIAESLRAVRVLETSHPPTYYLPPQDVRMALLQEAPGRTMCEWKGRASYYDLLLEGKRIPAVGWTYRDPTSAFQSIGGFMAFYPGKVDCFLDGERVQSQPGGFYGGWITRDIVGPFKGEPGTRSW